MLRNKISLQFTVKIWMKMTELSLTANAVLWNWPPAETLFNYLKAFTK